MSLPAGTELAPEKWLQHAIDAEYPMRPLPVGVVPSFDSGNTTAYQLYMTAGVCIPLVALFSSFRLLYATKFRRKIFAADQCASPFHYDRSMKDTDRGSILEVIFGLGFILCLAYIIMTLGAINHYGYLGRHAWNNGLEEAADRVTMLAVLVQIFAPLTICAVKVSILTLYLRVLGESMLWIRVTCVLCIILLLGHSISLATALGVMCAPYPNAGYSHVVRLMASISDQGPRARVLILVMIFGNTLIDLVVLFLPLPVIWKLVWTPVRNLESPQWGDLKTLAVFVIGSLCVTTTLSTLVMLCVSWTSEKTGLELPFLSLPVLRAGGEPGRKPVSLHASTFRPSPSLSQHIKSSLL